MHRRLHSHYRHSTNSAGSPLTSTRCKRSSTQWAEQGATAAELDALLPSVLNRAFAGEL